MIMRDCAHSRGGFSFQNRAVRLGELHGDLYPRVRLCALQGELCSKEHRLLFLLYFIHQITSTVVAVCIGYCLVYPPPYLLSHTLPKVDNVRQLGYAYRRVAGKILPLLFHGYCYSSINGRGADDSSVSPGVDEITARLPHSINVHPPRECAF